MNAVKRCLALIAATVVVGACSGDPTADLAGKDLTIRATPGAVWMRQDLPVSILLEAVDATGAPAPGNWTAVSTGPFTVTLDSTFLKTSNGTVGTARKFNIVATTEGDGSITFSGSGGQIVVPVRIAPALNGLNLTFTSPTPVADTVTVPLNASVTATVTPGMRLTAGTRVRLMTGPLANDSSLFTPINFSITADSLGFTFTPGPNSNGHLEVTGLASISTPTLTTTARTHTAFKTDIFDPISTSRLVLSTSTPAIGDTVSVTLPATYRFSPNTGIVHMSDTVINAAATRVQTNGLASPIVVGISPDSGTFRYIPAPGASGQPQFSNIRVRDNAAAWAFTSRTSTAYVVPSIVLAATFGPSNSNAANTPVTITMPAGFKLRPNSTLSYPGSILPPIVLSRAADSSSVTILPAPNGAAPVKIDSLMYTAAAGFKLSMPTTTTLTTGNAADLGADDPAGSPSFAAPTVTGNSVGWYDAYSMSYPDSTCDGSAGSQWYTLTVSVSGNYKISMNWSHGSDFDFGIMLKDGTYNDPGCGDYISTTGLNNKKPETTGIVALTAGQTYVINAMDFAGDGSGYVQITVAKVP